MHYKINPPHKGFTKFELRRYPGDEDIELKLLNNSYLMNRTELSEWIALTGCNNPSKVLDFAWNYKRVIYDLSTQNLEIPEDQSEMDEVLHEIETIAGAVFGKRTSLDDLGHTSPFDIPIDSQQNTIFRR